MKQAYKTPKAEKLVFDYSEVITTSGDVTDNKIENGCTVKSNGQTMNGRKQCGAGGTGSGKTFGQC